MNELTSRRVSLVAAKSACDRWHSHHEPPVGHRFSIGAFDGERLVCVATVSRPISTGFDANTTVEITRLASDGTVRGAASFTLRAAVKEAYAAGYRRVVSYTIVGEVGASYRAARWHPTAIVKWHPWSRASRKRRACSQPLDKIRWETGPDALPRDSNAQALLTNSVGKVLIPTRSPLQIELPLTVESTGP